MTNSISPETMNAQATPTGGGMALPEYTRYLMECQNQPAWRAKADKEMDYIDGNQLNSQILQKQRDLGIPPAVENLMGPAIDSVCGYEAKNRSDWKVSPDQTGDLEADDTAKALNFKLNQAERNSGADRACSDAFRPQVSVGLGWVEVAKESDPFKYQYRCKAVHRNEIFWDWLSKEPDLSDARYLLRRRWTDASLVKIKFPEHAAMVDTFGRGRPTADQFLGLMEGGNTPALANNWEDERGWSIEEQEWRDISTGRVCLFELWYRRWESIIVIRTPDGRVVEYAKQKPLHVALVASGVVTPERTAVARIYVSFWMGPHLLHDGPSPYRHKDFPYVPFWGKREDRTAVPYGAARGMMFLQDNVNSSISKIRWGLAATRVERTKGAVAMKDGVFRQQIARPDADIVLDPDVMAKPGAVFKVHRDFDVSEQQYKMLGDSRLGIQRASGITAGFQGQQGTARSGVQESTQIEQTTQQLADLMDNFKFGRAKVGELLLALIVQDMIGKQEEVVIPKSPTRPEQRIALNVPAMDDDGIQYLTNDVERIRLKVAVSDVPTTPSFRAQQLQAMSEAFKAMPPEYQAIALPHLLNLMDIPDREEIVSEIMDARGRETPEQIQKRIDEAVDRALKDAMIDLKQRELGLKETKLDVELRKIVADTVLTTVQAAFSSMQAAGQIAMNPAIAPVADKIMQAGGYQPPNPAGVDPNFPQPEGVPVDAAALAPVHENTSPQFPPHAAEGMQGIETTTTADNLEGATP